MLAMRARRGSDARIGAETVSVTRADWASMVDVDFYVVVIAVEVSRQNLSRRYPILPHMYHIPIFSLA